MFMAASTPDEIPKEEAPDWVREWLDSREARSEKKAKSAKNPPDTKAAAKRKDKKLARVDEGVELLTQFLEDLARQGIADTSVKDPGTWEEMARRMVDSQAPGLAGRLRELESLAQKSTNWEAPLIHAMGNLHLLLQAWRTRPELSDDLRAEVEQAVGVSVSKEDVLSGPVVEDSWFVASRVLLEQERLSTSITWLLGIKSGRWAKILKFGALGQKPLETWPLGGVVKTGMHFYPGTTNLRALPSNEGAPAKIDQPTNPKGTFSDLLERYAGLRSRNPWHRREPFYGMMAPGENRILLDAVGNSLPCGSSDSKIDVYYALSGGRPIPACVEWDGHSLTLLSALSDGQLVNLS